MNNLARSIKKKILLLHQCQSAALDELFGKPGACFPRYQTAQILFHSLAQQTDHPQDKSILGKCRLLKSN